MQSGKFIVHTYLRYIVFPIFLKTGALESVSNLFCLQNEGVEKFDTLSFSFSYG